MAAPVPKRVSNEIVEEIGAAVLDAKRFYEQDSPELLRWDDAIDRRVHHRFPGEANFCWAMLAQLRGDIEHSEQLLENARKLGVNDFSVASGLFTGYSNLLFASKALPLIPRTFDVAHRNVAEGLPQALGMGAIAEARRLLDQAENAKLDLQAVAQIATLKEIVSNLTATGADDLELARAIDCAGEVLRSRRLFWLDRAPRFLFDSGMGAMGIRYRVDVTPREAARMNVELADLLAGRELHTLPITLSFIGVAAE